MALIRNLFVTPLHQSELTDQPGGPDIAELDMTCRVLAADDRAGQRWCQKNGYPGYTSYASLNDLPWRFPVFKRLQKRLDADAKAFAQHLEFDLGKRKLRLDSLWVNVLPEGGAHSAHIHPHSVLSGTLYVAMPQGTSAIKFEDPRHAMMMAAPPRKPKAALEHRSFVYVEPTAGTILMWESWLRHEVPINQAAEERISISFNYAWD
jgi:uncharacterized protein (TIGR02466 family)